MPIETIKWSDEGIVIIDQTQLPERFHLMTLTDVDMVAEAIRSLRVRGAPAIGIAGAMGMALAAYRYPGDSPLELRAELVAVSKILAATRPTAVNLFWALDRIGRLLASLTEADIGLIKESVLREAHLILDEDKAACRAMGRNGAALLPQDCTVLTHCNAGGLATGDFGTALGVIYAAAEAGKQVRVYADETRPLLQGSRLTAWELQQSDIEVTVLCDNAAGSLLASGAIDAVIVGADRIAANGDAANKIGTYPLSVLAREHHVPFYVVAPTSTIDPSIATGADIPIEFRSGDEIGNGFGRRTAPEGVRFYNPAFDVTPAANITAIITETKTECPPYSFSAR